MIGARVLTAAAIILFLSTQAQAVIVTPVDATASSAFAVPATATIDGSGMSGVGPIQDQTHDTDEEAMWIAGTGSQAQDEFLEFTLDQNYDLSSALVWNYNGIDGFGGDNSGRGIEQMEILISTSLTGSYSSIGTFNLTQADPLFSPNLSAETLMLTGATNVRRVMFDINSAFNGATAEFVGLSEVRFDGTAVPPGDDRTWFADSFGNWSDGVNWDPNFAPDGNTQTATFGGAITASRTVVTDAAVTVKAITFANTNSYVIAGAGSVTLDSDTGTSTITVNGNADAGAHQFQAVVDLANNTNIDVGTGAELIFNNAFNLNGNTVNKTGSGALVINNQLNTGGGTLNNNAGSIQGSGTVGGHLNNSAEVAPRGMLSVNGNLTMGPSSTLAIDVSGATEFDQLNVDGTAMLDGDLMVSVNGSDVDPTNRGQTDELAVVVADMINGTFDSVDYEGTTLASGSTYVGSNQNGDDGLFRILSYNDDDVTVTNYLAALGDANGDRLIDGQDFVIWNSNKFTAGNVWTDGDFNGDGLVDGQDFVLWNSNKFTSVDGFAVPEPTIFSGWLIAMVAMGYRRSLRRDR